MAIVSAWVPFLGRQIEARWFSWPNLVLFAPVPLLTAYVAYRLFRTWRRGSHRAVPALDRHVPARIPRPRRQPVPLYRAADPDDLAGGQHRDSQLFASSASRWRCRSPSPTRPMPTMCSAERSPRRSRAADTADGARPRAGQRLLAARLVDWLLCPEPRRLCGPGLRAESDHSTLRLVQARGRRRAADLVRQRVGSKSGLWESAPGRNSAVVMAFRKEMQRRGDCHLDKTSRRARIILNPRRLLCRNSKRNLQGRSPSP